MVGKAVLGISAVCCTSVMATRQKTGVEQKSSVSIVESIGSLLSQGDQNSRAFALIQQEMTPGVESDYDGALRGAMKKLEDEVETKILKAQEEAQSRLDGAYGKYEAAASELRENKKAADAIDEAFFECTGDEQAKLAKRKAAEGALAAATSAQNQACKMMNDNDDFSWASDADFKFDCDVGKQGDCQAKLDALEAKVAQMEKQVTDELKADQQKYSQMKADCDSKTEQKDAAQQALREAQQAFSQQQTQCNGIKQSREPAFCKAGQEMQVKCGLESSYSQLLEREKADEADRIQEWQSTSAMKCLLGKYADDSMGEVVGSDDLQACSGGELGFERLNEKSDGFQGFAATQQCKNGPVKFFNGQTWKVYKGQYTKESFAPSLTLAGTAPFPFCGAAVGEQNVGGIGGRLELQDLVGKAVNIESTESPGLFLSIKDAKTNMGAKTALSASREAESQWIFRDPATGYGNMNGASSSSGDAVIESVHSPHYKNLLGDMMWSVPGPATKLLWEVRWKGTDTFSLYCPHHKKFLSPTSLVDGAQLQMSSEPAFWRIRSS